MHTVSFTEISQEHLDEVLAIYTHYRAQHQRDLPRARTLQGRNARCGLF